MDTLLENRHVSASGSGLLEPILVAGYGRSGTTAVMSLLASDRQIAFDREYPYENRYLSYYAKLSLILKDRVPDQRFTSNELYVFEESLLGPWPWRRSRTEGDADPLLFFWDSFSCNAKNENPNARFYAEKAPAWLAAVVRQSFRCSVIHLFRDPRDIYLSTNAFMKKRSYYGFHRTPADSDLDHARNLGLEILNYFENFVWDMNYNPGSFLLRYEDLASHPDQFLAHLRDIGLSPDMDRAFEHVEGHRTASSLNASVGRWQHEDISPEVRQFFERQLGREMKTLGYHVETTDLCPLIEFRTGQPVPQLSNPADGRLEGGPGAMTAHIIGGDFGILLPFEPIRAEEASEVWVSAAGCVGDHFSLFWRDADSGFSEERSIHVKYVPGSHWRIVRFRTAKHPLWKGVIQQIRIDLFNGHTSETPGVGYFRWVRLVS